MSANQTLLHAVKQQLDSFVVNSPENFVADLGMMPIYDHPLLGVASAEDVLWEKLKEPEVVGPQHLSPAEWLGGAKSVLSCFLPFSEQIRSANRSEGWPATEWVYGRYEGGFFNDTVRSFLVDTVQKVGGHAMCPALDKRFAVVHLRSNWSERHVGFIAGLGTFSLNRSLITESGSAGRFASVVTDVDLEPTQRLYTQPDEYCTKCGACIRRCPPLAIDKNGKDNAICSVYVHQETKARFNPRYGCGKCQTAVPCENCKPPVPEPKHSC